MRDKLQRFRQQFNDETRERIQSINNLALALEKDASRQDLIERLKREMHTIKGGSRILGLRSISQLAHFFEEFFLQVANGSRPMPKRLADRLFRALDLMSDLLEKEETETTIQTVDDFIHHFTVAEPLAEVGPMMDPLERKDKFKQLLKSKIQRRLKAQERKIPKPDAPGLKMPPDKALPVGKTDSQSETASDKVSAQAESLPAKEVLPVSTDIETLPGKEDKKTAFSHSFRIDSKLIDTISDGALQLKVMSSFLDLFIREYTSLANSLDLLQKEFADTLASSPPSELHDGLERQQLTLRDLARSALEKKKFITARINAFQNYFNDFFRNLEDLKLIPLATIFSIYPRFVRDYANRSGKQIEFDYQGGATRLDKRITEAINESLIHLLRNAVDHGIESPAERTRAGKPVAGRVTLSAVARGDKVVISIGDDGRGFDIELIKGVAIRKKIITEAECANLPREEILNLTFLPGFSTSPIITDTSGRGVGMDAVLHAVKCFNGSLKIDSRPGEGTTIRLELPISISTTRILLVQDQGEICAIPTELIKEVRRINLADLTRKGPIYFLLEDGKSLPAAPLGTILRLERDSDRPAADAKILLIIQTSTDRFGLVVDQTLQQENVIVHRKDPFIQNIPFIAGVSVNVIGEPILVIDPHALVKFFQAPEKALLNTPMQTKARPVKKVILLVEDSMVTREMEKVIIESAGYKVIEAINGVDALDQLSGQHVDCIVTDVEMPVMDGFILSERIRQMPAVRDIPIVIVTTRENREDKIRGIQAGANAYITKKHFDQMKLLETIQRLI